MVFQYSQKLETGKNSRVGCHETPSPCWPCSAHQFRTFSVFVFARFTVMSHKNLHTYSTYGVIKSTFYVHVQNLCSGLQSSRIKLHLHITPDPHRPSLSKHCRPRLIKEVTLSKPVHITYVQYKLWCVPVSVVSTRSPQAINECTGTYIWCIYSQWFSSVHMQYSNNYIYRR